MWGTYKVERNLEMAWPEDTDRRWKYQWYGWSPVCLIWIQYPYYFLKMDQSRPLFVYFRPFLITISIIQIEKSIDGVLEIRTRGCKICRHRQNHGAMAADLNKREIWKESFEAFSKPDEMRWKKRRNKLRQDPEETRSERAKMLSRNFLMSTFPDSVFPPHFRSNQLLVDFVFVAANSPFLQKNCAKTNCTFSQNKSFNVKEKVSWRERKQSALTVEIKLAATVSPMQFLHRDHSLCRLASISMRSTSMPTCTCETVEVEARCQVGLSFS